MGFVSVCVCVRALAGFKLSQIGSDKWHAPLQKAGVRRLCNSGYADNWDIAEGDSGLHSVSWKQAALHVILSGLDNKT